MRIKNTNIMRQTKLNEFFSTESNEVSMKDLKVNNDTDKKKQTYLLRFDGASKGNPGKAGSGAVLYLNNVEIWNGSKYIGNNYTCNYAEYYGLIIGLEEAVKKDIKYLDVEGDSLLIINQLKGKYSVKSKNLIDLYTKAKKLSKFFDYITFSHIYRNHNVRADELANLLIPK
jgi:ribonuclease HI|tara:strand:- start:253 stop:768 length:516 start_codon:yes stop_codon:yes gene_type:complete